MRSVPSRNHKLEDLVTNHFSDNIETAIHAAEQLPSLICKSAEKISQVLLNEGKILACGNGASSANVRHFTSILLNHLQKERPALPAIDLCSDRVAFSDSADDGYQEIFAKQIHAFGLPNDLLLIISDDNTISLSHAIQAAHDQNVPVILLSGKNNGQLKTLLYNDDIELSVPSLNPLRIRELHLLVIHCMCDLLDEHIFGT